MSIEKLMDGYETNLPESIAEANKHTIRVCKAMFSMAENEIKKLEVQANEIEIIDDETEKTAVSMATQIKKMHKVIEKKRKEIKAPYLSFTKELDGLVRPVRVALEKIENSLRKKMVNYINIQEEEKRKAAERERKSREEAARALGIQNEQESFPGYFQQENLPAKKVTVSSGSTRTKKVWTFSVDNPDIVPRDFLIIDEAAIKMAIANGIREIPGIKIFQKNQVSIYTRG